MITNIIANKKHCATPLLWNACFWPQGVGDLAVLKFGTASISSFCLAIIVHLYRYILYEYILWKSNRHEMGIMEAYIPAQILIRTREP